MKNLPKQQQIHLIDKQLMSWIELMVQYKNNHNMRKHKFATERADWCINELKRLRAEE